MELQRFDDWLLRQYSARAERTSLMTSLGSQRKHRIKTVLFTAYSYIIRVGWLLEVPFIVPLESRAPSFMRPHGWLQRSLGLRHCLLSETSPMTGAEVVTALIAGILGVLKGLTVIRRAAHQALYRLQQPGSEQPLLRLFPPRTCLLIGMMMTTGIALRNAHYAPLLKSWLIAVIYPAVSLALLLGPQSSSAGLSARPQRVVI